MDQGQFSMGKNKLNLRPIFLSHTKPWVKEVIVASAILTS